VSDGVAYIWVKTVFPVANNWFCSSIISGGLRLSHSLELYFYDFISGQAGRKFTGNISHIRQPAS
jgi:hypothetical protein